MSKAWGGVGRVGSWAADAEREESEEAAAAAASAPTESQSFPSLREAVSAKPKKKKMTLNEFYTASGGRGSGLPAESKGLTPDEMLRLPTGPKERSAEEMQYGRLGGGFYNRSGPPPGGRMRDRDDADAPSWGGGGRRQYGGFDNERRGPPPRVSDYDQPSRADEVDDWSMAKKALPSLDSGRQSRYSSLGGGGIGGGSRADEVDNWTIGKKPLPARSSVFGSGFGDSGPQSDRWTRVGIHELERERPKLSLDPPRRDAGSNESIRTNRASPFGAARPREEVLAEKGLDWKKLDMEIEAKKSSAHSSRPTSAQSSRPSSAQSAGSEGPGVQHGLENVAVKPRPKVNPFGDAKPREILLQKRGQDWRKIDLELEHRSVDRPETEEEKLLKEEIETLKNVFIAKANSESLREFVEQKHSIQETISLKEKELEKLVHDLDDRVRFGLKVVGRPGSGAGRAVGFPERPHSQSGSFDDSRSVESMDRPRSRGMQDNWARSGDERPRSRGTPDSWTRSVDGRRGFQGGRERGFLGSRDFDGSRTRERW
uniref:Uncharacterized protein MANES_13G022300 n=1 Tax=Rhizophora mucronata TaxID=61149 RepID=A0A2P2JXS0_RHIMU